MGVVQIEELYDCVKNELYALKRLNFMLHDYLSKTQSVQYEIWRNSMYLSKTKDLILIWRNKTNLHIIIAQLKRDRYHAVIA